MKCSKDAAIPVTRHGGSHILKKIGSQVTVKLSAFVPAGLYPQEDS
jgi:hypothetical protein